MRILKEIFVVILLGMFPVLGAFLYGGVEYLIDTMKSMLVHKWIMYYSMFGAAAFYFVAYLDYRFLFHNARVESIHNLVSSVLYEAACSLLGILRVASGVLLSVGVIWLIYDFDLNNLKKVIFLFGMGIVATIECIFIGASLEHAKNVWLRNKI